jgi:hypothetical protein
LKIIQAGVFSAKQGVNKKIAYFTRKRVVCNVISTPNHGEMYDCDQSKTKITELTPSQFKHLKDIRRAPNKVHHHGF